MTGEPGQRKGEEVEGAFRKPSEDTENPANHTSVQREAGVQVSLGATLNSGRWTSS